MVSPFDDTVIFASNTLCTEEKEQLIQTEKQFRKSFTGQLLSKLKKRVSSAGGKSCCSFKLPTCAKNIFLLHLNLKMKYRNRLNVEYDLRLYLPSVVPDFKALCRSIQAKESLNFTVPTKCQFLPCLHRP